MTRPCNAALQAADNRSRRLAEENSKLRRQLAEALGRLRPAGTPSPTRPPRSEPLG